MVAKQQNRVGIGNRRVLSEVALEENRRHGGDVLMTETQIGACKAGVAGLNGFDANLALTMQHVAGKDFFGNGHGPRPGLDWRQKYLALQACNVEGKQSTILDDLAGDLVFAFGELAERNFFVAADLIDEVEVGRGEHAEVLAVLLVNALDVFRDDELDAGIHLRIGRRLAARTFAAPLAAHRRHESAAFHVHALDGCLVAALQSGVGELAQGLIEEEADVRRGDLVGRDVVAQLGIALRVSGVPGKVFAGELALDELRVFGEEKDPPLQLHSVRALGNRAVQQRISHLKILSQKSRAGLRVTAGCRH